MIVSLDLSQITLDNDCLCSDIGEDDAIAFTSLDEDFGDWSLNEIMLVRIREGRRSFISNIIGNSHDSIVLSSSDPALIGNRLTLANMASCSLDIDYDDE